MTRRALVLGGGGVRGAFQVGMVRELTKTLDFDIIRGVSVGAINGAFLAQAPAGSDSRAAMEQQALALEGVWSKLGHAMSSLPAPPRDELERMKMMGEALRQFIGSAIRPDLLAASNRDFTAGYVSLLSGRYMEAEGKRPDILDLVQASAALPPLFPWVDTKTDLLVDGGYRNITPLSSAFKAERKPDEIYVLLTRQITSSEGRLLDSAIEPQPLEPDWASRNGPDPHALYAQVSTRLVDILMDEVYIEDVKRAIQENSLARVLDELEARESARSAATVRELYESSINRRPAYVKLYVLAPRRRFDPEAPPGHGDDTAAFKPELIARAIEHGAEVARDLSQWVWHPGREKKPGAAPRARHRRSLGEILRSIWR